LEYTICPVRDKILAEKFSETFKLRAVRYGMSVENNGGLSNPVPSGTECGDSHMAYLTARGKLVAVNFSTNILSRRDRKTGRSCPVRDKMSVENAGCTSNPVPSGTECDDCHIAYLTARGKLVAVNYSTNILSRRETTSRRPPVRYSISAEQFSETFKLRAVRDGMSAELVPVIRPVSGRNYMIIFRQLFRKVSRNLQEGFLTFRKVSRNLRQGFLMFRKVSCNLQEGFLTFRKVPRNLQEGFLTFRKVPRNLQEGFLTFRKVSRNLQEGFLMFRTVSRNLREDFLTFRTVSSPARACCPRRQIPQSAKLRKGFSHMRRASRAVREDFPRHRIFIIM
jgi:hypothetical protein